MMSDRLMILVPDADAKASFSSLQAPASPCSVLSSSLTALISKRNTRNVVRFFETAKTLVLPNEESLKKTQFQIRFLDPSAKKIPGSISSSALIPALPSEKIHYLDAGCITVDPLSEAEILRILEAGGSYGS